MADIESALRLAVQIHGSIRAAATKLGFSEDAAARVLSGEGVGGKNLKSLRKALTLPEDAPLRQSAPLHGSALSGNVSLGVRATGTLSPPTAVREAAPTPYAAAQYAEVRGRSIEVEALLAYALERQRLLTQALAQASGLTPNATPEALEAATARQLKLDAEAADARAREA